MKKTYAVLGAGMQGTAAAYDLAKFADPKVIRVGDVSFDQAKKSAWRVNDLVGDALCEPAQVNALDPTNLAKFLEGVDVILSCVPYWMHPKIAKVAIETKTSMVDLGGNTEITMQTLHMDEAAKAAGVTLVPDCGLAPGLVNNLGCYLIEHLDPIESVRLYCGVLPQNPKPPFNYKLTFNVEGLVTEYDFQAVIVRNHEIALVDTLAELEELHIDELGQMEAFTTSGGTSTAPYTFKDRVNSYEYKTIRYPGHCERMRIFKDFGFWREDEVEVGGKKIVPKDVFNRVFGESLAKFEDRDLCAVRAVGVGMKDGKPTRLQIDILDREDETTGFTSMERLTGFSQSIYAIEIAHGNFAPGCLRYETAMTGTKFVDEIQKRGIQLAFQEQALSEGPQPVGA
ncbi:MAG TPA: saccharopine dehydrogenase C-terminal domain-containing protein [Fimbriimonadaceae bacterium]|nr:saccharopine dehydrogenase C-terminal domain-containing protein [Fimbriimonadaceae bacterium]